MGYQVEYMLDLPPIPARDWLSSFDGWWNTPEDPSEIPSGEFNWGGQPLLVSLGPTASHVAVPSIKYSWLVMAHSPSVEWVDHFERYLCKALPAVRAVRLDELLRVEWEAWADCDWDQLPDPVGSLWSWLPSNEYGTEYFRLFGGEQKYP